MTTFGELTESCLGYLTSFGQARDKLTSTSGVVAIGDKYINVDDAKQVDRGLIEIDDELIAIQASDSSTNIVTVFPWGRGQRGTTAAAHAAGVRVVSNPQFPRSTIKAEINRVALGLYPDLFGVSTDSSQTVRPTQVTYPLPANAEGIVSVSYQSTGPSKMWIPVTRYKMIYDADTTAFPTNRALDIYQPMQAGRPLRITYRTRFGSLTSESQDISAADIDESYVDIIRYGVVGRLLMGLDAARLAMDSVENAQKAQQVTPTSASSVGKQQLQMMQMRIAEERRRLLTQYPTLQVRQS